MLADLPEKLGETIPDFHNMEFRMQQLREAVAQNAAGRMEKVQSLVDDIEKDADEMCAAERLYREGKLPKRICHCDTKVSNMLFDKDGNVLCVIDLDTTMPSFVFSDFGDFLRNAGLTGLVINELQLFDELLGVVRSGLHGHHAGALFRSHIFCNCLVNQSFDVTLQKRVENGFGVGLVEIVPRVITLVSRIKMAVRKRQNLLDHGTCFMALTKRE